MKKLLALLLLLPALVLAKPVGQQPIALGWIAPTTYEDDTLLDPQDIGGFNIYYYAASCVPTVDGTGRTDHNQCTTDAQKITINDGNATSYLLSNLPVMSGRVVIVMTAFDINGVESWYSNSIEGTTNGEAWNPKTPKSPGSFKWLY